MQMMAVYSCVRILAEPIAGLAYVEQLLTGAMTLTDELFHIKARSTMP